MTTKGPGCVKTLLSIKTIVPRHLSRGASALRATNVASCGVPSDVLEPNLKLVRSFHTASVDSTCCRRFIKARRKAILSLIEQAMGKSTYRGETADAPQGETVVNDD